MTSRIRDAAGAADAAEVHRLMTELAAYEREPEAVETTVADFARDLGTAFHAALAEVPAGDGWRAVGVALYFFSYSSWTGRALYLEDIFVEPASRGAGLGGALMRTAAAAAVAAGCRRMQWVVLDWNVRSVEFYEAAGAQRLPQWQLMRMDGEALSAYAQGRPRPAAPGDGERK